MNYNENIAKPLLLAKFISLVLMALACWVQAVGQETLVRGRIIDVQTGDPVPFANVVIKGTTTGTTTDFAGYYKLTSVGSADSVVASYIGYVSKTKALKIGQPQTIDFQLQESIRNLEEVVFVAEENPAYAILRKVVQNKPLNDKRSLTAYEFESYNKIEFALDNLTDKFRNRKLVQKVKRVIDSVDQIASEDGEAILPIFISESISDFYYRRDPKLEKEHIKKTRISGVGIQDGSLVSQFIGSSFQEYNFYQNWLNIWQKEFVSPIADGWKGYYQVYLMDSLFIGEHFCYRLDVVPRRSEDLAFNGSIWVTKNEYALKQVDLWVDRLTNLNFIEKLKLQQELEPTEAGPWMPVRSRILTDFRLIGEFGIAKNSPGVLAKFYTSNKHIKVDQPHALRFYDLTLELAEDALTPNLQFWEENRHVPLTSTEQSVMVMIDTLKKIRPVKRITDLGTFLATGYIDIGKLGIGPYPLFYASNNIEGHRFRLGGRLITDVRKDLEFKGYLAYGTTDKNFKYGWGIDYIISRKPWTEIRIYRTRDIQQVGLTFDDVYGANPFTFEAYYRNRNHTAPYYLKENRFQFKRELSKGLNQSVTLRQRAFQPIDVDSSFNYAYQLEPGVIDSPLRKDFEVTEITLETRYGKDELWIQNDNQRFSMGAVRAPVITFRYTLGMDGVLGGDFTYHKASVNLLKKLKMGFLGVSSFSLTGGKIFGDVPLPLLKGHIGNESPFYNSIAYNTMGFSEFVSDTYASLNYQHQFEGLLLNRIPLFKKLKWRAVATGNVLIGGVGEGNRALHSVVGTNGLPNQEIRSLDQQPYIEVGYGIENILKILRVDAIHRLTYLDRRSGQKFALKFSLQFGF